jgi:selenocysteine lyase/cysteine desulfurase
MTSSSPYTWTDFRRRFPHCGDPARFQTLRQQEYRRLDEEGHVYLDYTGGGLYPESLVQGHAFFLQTHVLGNTHSENPTSLSSTRLMQQAREDVLRFFRADPEEYAVIFTANASAALKLVGESYPFQPGSHFCLIADNHNSVQGIREFARHKGARITYVPLDPQTLCCPELRSYLEHWDTEKPNLFAMPAQSNFSGVQHALEAIELAHELGHDVILDAAAFVPTNRLDLSQVHPDFVPVSFYKMFGYPTGVGALIARKEALARLVRPWFGGGTVKLVSTRADLHILAEGYEAFEDGTPNYLSFPAISMGLRFMDSLGVERIHNWVMALTGYLLEEMQALRHSNGAPLVRIYGPKDTTSRGGTIAFNLMDPQGDFFPYQLVEQEANGAMISIRAGCFCNPGAGEFSLDITAEDVRRCVKAATVDGVFDVNRYHACLGSKPSGAVRASLGMATSFDDIVRFLTFLTTYLDRKAPPAPAQAADC